MSCARAATCGTQAVCHPVPNTPPKPTLCLPHTRLQFNVGHLEAVSGAQDAIRASGWDGVLLGGNYVAGAPASLLALSLQLSV